MLYYTGERFRGYILDNTRHVGILFDKTNVLEVKLRIRFWHERSALQSVAVRRSTGNDVSGHYFHHYLFILFFPPFFFFFFFFPFFSPSQPFLIEGGLGSKNLFSEIA